MGKIATGGEGTVVAALSGIAVSFLSGDTEFQSGCELRCLSGPGLNPCERKNRSSRNEELYPAP